MSESLLNEIRATKPVAPAALRDREPCRPQRSPFSPGSACGTVLVAPVTLVSALATVIGLT
jgi:hypothetical protein